MMSSALSPGLASQLPRSTKDSRFVAHLAGITIFFACLTAPAGLLLVKYFGDYPFRFFEPTLILAMSIALIQRGGLKALALPITVLLTGLITAFFLETVSASTVVEAQGIFYFIAAVIIFSNLRTNTNLKIISSYTISCLWVSALIELLIYSGKIENTYGVRSSFSGDSISDSGLGRLITPTFVLAQLSICLVVIIFLRGYRNIPALILALAPAIIIAALAGSRTTLLIVVIPLLLNVLGRGGQKSRRRILIL